MSSSTETEIPIPSAPSSGAGDPAGAAAAESNAFVVPDSADASDPRQTGAVDIDLTGRNVDIPEHFRRYVAEKLARLERYDGTLQRFDVELNHERNRRQAKSCQRVEMTAKGRGPVVRAEACADSFYAALESAVDKLEARLRRACDQRKVHHGRRGPVSVAEALAAKEAADVIAAGTMAAAPDVAEPTGTDPEPTDPDGGPGRVVRVKEHPGTPMSVDDALYEMELVGHDFFLFHDATSDRPSVVYRRQAFDYGVIRLS